MKKNIKLFTWDRYLICIIAIAIGSCISPFKEYSSTGMISNQSLIMSAITFVIGVIIVIIIGAYANKSEKEN